MIISQTNLKIRRSTPADPALRAREAGKLPRLKSFGNHSNTSSEIVIVSRRNYSTKFESDLEGNMTRSSEFFSGKNRNRAVSFYDFKGLIAPVFSCFKDDEDRSLNFEFIDRYAAWLKSKEVCGVLVNSTTGESYALNAEERKLQAEIWWLCAQKHDLLCMIDIGSASLPDTLDAARHADEMGVHAVVCSSNVYRQPKNISELVAYCSTVAENCGTRPFFYHHNQKMNDIRINLLEFYDKAEADIPNFFGIHFSSTELDEGARCLRSGRVVVLNTPTMLAAGLLIGFEAVAMTCANICPQLCFDILHAMKSNDLQTAVAKQHRLCDFIWSITRNSDQSDSILAMKNCFNEVMESNVGEGFTAGPTRSFY